MNKIFIPTALPTLRSDRLTLRMMVDSDAQDLYEIYGDPLVMKYTGEAPFPNLATVNVMLASVRRLLFERQSLEWAVVLNSTQAVIGTCGLHSVNAVDLSAEVGCLLKRDAWGAGHMRNAVALLMTFAVSQLNLTRLVADVDPENERAQRLFRRLGYLEIRKGTLAIDLVPTVPERMFS